MPAEEMGVMVFSPCAIAGQVVGRETGLLFLSVSSWSSKTCESSRTDPDTNQQPGLRLVFLTAWQPRWDRKPVFTKWRTEPPCVFANVLVNPGFGRLRPVVARENAATLRCPARYQCAAGLPVASSDGSRNSLLHGQHLPPRPTAAPAA